MMVLSYIIGQRYYPVGYHFIRCFGYLGLAIILYLASTVFTFTDVLPRLSLNTLLLAIYIATVLLIEKPRLSKVF